MRNDFCAIKKYQGSCLDPRYISGSSSRIQFVCRNIIIYSFFIFLLEGIPGAVLHQQQTTGSAGAGEVQEGQIPRMSLTIPHRESMFTSQQVRGSQAPST